MKKKLVLVGGGGHCRSCIDVIEKTGEWDIIGIVDLPDKKGESVLNYKINACDGDIPMLVEKGYSFLITLGQIKTPVVRQKIFNQLKSLNAPLPVIISPLAYVSPYAQLAEGTIVMHHAMINASVQVGANCIINSKALIEHDVSIGDCCHISTGAIINGGVQMGNGTFMGSAAVTKEYIQIGVNVIVGAGTRVMKNIEDHQTVI